MYLVSHINNAPLSSQINYVLNDIAVLSNTVGQHQFVSAF